MHSKVIISSLFLACIILSGCGESYIVEELGFIHSVGYELNEQRESEQEGRIIMTAAIPQISTTASENQEVLSIVAHSSKDGKYNMARQSARMLVSGQKRTALFSTNLAEMGIMDLMDSLQRDPVIGSNLHIVVVNGSTKELLEGEYPEQPRTSRYVFELVQNESKMVANLDTNLHQFVRDYYDDGIDPIAPIVKKGKEEIIIDGIGLFDNDKYVDKIDPKDARIFLMLHGEYVGGNILTQIKLEDYKDQGNMFITFNTLESKRKVKVKENPSKGDQITVDIHLDVKGSVEEILGSVDLSKDHIQKEIEQQLASYIQDVSKKIISTLQDKKADSLGIGQQVRNTLGYEKWNNLDWKKTFPTIEVNVSVDVKLKGFGTTK